MSATTEEASVPPQVLLAHHLKSLKLPTFAREYENVAAECVRAQIDYPRYLLRLCELERIDRGYVPVTAVGSELLFEENWLMTEVPEYGHIWPNRQSRWGAD